MWQWLAKGDKMKKVIYAFAISIILLATSVYGAGSTNFASPPDDTAYNATSWNGSRRAPTKNAVRDAIESISPGAASAIPASYLDTDGALTANSDTKVATQQAVKEYADLMIPKSTFVAAGDLMYGYTAGTPAILTHPGAANYFLYTNGVITVAYLSGADLVTLASGGTANCIWGEKADGSGIECKTSLSLSGLNLTSTIVNAQCTDSGVPAACCTGTGTGTCGTFLPSGTQTAITGEGQIYWHSGNDALYLGDAATAIVLDMTAGVTYTFPGASGTLAVLGDNTFTGTESFTGSVTVGDAGDDIVVKLNTNAADGTFSGTTITATVDSGATSAFGQCMMVASDGELTHTDADSSSTMPCVCILVTSGTGAGKQCLTHGTVTETSWNWTPGAIILVGTDPTTTTGLVSTAPSGSGDQVQRVGIALSADTILFTGGLTVVEVP